MHGRCDVTEVPESTELTAYARLLHELEELQQDLLMQEMEAAEILQQVDARHLPSAANLIHYLGLRRRDMRPLQEKLAAVGLSSLGRSESHVLTNLHCSVPLLQRALGLTPQQPPLSAINQALPGAAIRQANTAHLLGKPPAPRQVRIMVTLPGESADDSTLIKELLTQGMDCVRIHCAHDGPEVWERLIRQIRQAERESGRPCRILMDLGGPRLRTGEIAPGPAVLKWRPSRDAYGHVTAPARIWLHPDREIFTCPAPADACLPIQGDWLAQATARDRIEFTDARGALRSLQLVGQVGNGFWAEASQTAYVTPGLELHLLRVPVSGHPRRFGSVGLVGALPRLIEPIRLQRGDSLILAREAIPGQPAQFDENGRLLRAAIIGCSLPEVFVSVKPGERLLIDDGRIGGVIHSVSPHEIMLEITQARDGGEKLLAERDIHLPDSCLELDGLTKQDIAHLEFAARHADMVGLSGVRRPADVQLLQYHLARLGAANLGVVLKIDTRAAVECLPELLCALLRWPSVGVMLARRDLAVECGYERLAEVQEEILWLAEAAHLPVIWASQALEGLSRSGKPSRAEITDAAMSERAECVMLNKGLHLIEAIRALDDILQRMPGHQQQKSALLRRLHW